MMRAFYWLPLNIDWRWFVVRLTTYLIVGTMLGVGTMLTMLLVLP
jgi:hypothetical protein